MNTADNDRIGAAVRTALAADEPAQVPVFDHVWTRARAAGTRPHAGWTRPAAVAASLIAVAALAWMVRPAGPSATDDYRLAEQVVAAHGLGTPTDRWLEQVPRAPLAGLPDLNMQSVPVIPEESFL